jgi:signal transduction histidine kinase/CheY-like chemotaxis protein
LAQSDRDSDAAESDGLPTPPQSPSASPNAVIDRAPLGQQTMIKLRPFLCRGLAISGPVLLPPSVFAPVELERAFLADHARRTAPQRRAGIFLALFTWVAYAGLDYFNIGPGIGAERVYFGVMLLRMFGAAVLILAIFLTYQPFFLNGKYTERFIYLFSTICYMVLLTMVANLDFPFSYVVDYPGLILCVLFIVGLLRIGAWTFVAIVITWLPTSVIALYLSNQISIQMYSYKWSKGFHLLLSFFSEYYYVNAMIYVASSMAIGYAIANQLERDARAAFLRERQLESSNRVLLDSRRDVDSKTLALVAAKEELRASAERESLNKSKFLADAAHDLSQPTQAVSLLAESARLALARNDFQRAGSLIESAGRAAQIARSSFKAVLELSQLESGLVKPTLSPFGVLELVAEVVAPLRIIAEARGVQLRVRAARDDRAMARSDRVLLGRVLANLAANAVKYSDPAKGARQVVLIGFVPLSNRVRIDVIDNGVGIPESERAEVFKPFVQLNNPQHNRDKGLGLGLSIVTAIVALLPAHDLTMWSREGRGTRFSLEVPRQDGTSTAPVDGGDVTRRPTDLASLFVWYVEDDELARVAAVAFLEELGVLTEQASGFEDLERRLEFTERRPDLVITDFRLPGGHTADDVFGLFVRRWDADVPLMVLTGEAVPRRAGTFGRYAEVLRKPAAPEEIIEAIRRLCFKAPRDPAVEE